MKKIVKIIAIVLIVFVVISVSKNLLIKNVITTGVQLVTGLQMSMKKLDVSLLKSHLVIKGLTIKNPKGFEEPIMLDMPEVTVDFNIGSLLFKKTIHLESMVINMKSFNVVRNKDGELNLDALKVAADAEPKEKKVVEKEAPKPKKKGAMPKIKIDYLKLVIGDISFMNFSGEEPETNTFTFNIDEEHRDIDHPIFIFTILMQKAMLKASVAKLGDFGGIGDALAGTTALAGDALATGKDAAVKTVDTAEKVGKEAVETAKVASDAAVGTVKEVGSTAKEAASAIKGKLGAFGGKLKSLAK